MNERELIAVFWGTCAAIPVILGIVWLVNRGLDEQAKADRQEINDFARDLVSRQVYLSPEDYSILHAAIEAEYPSLTAPRAADSPSAADSSRGQR